MWLLLIGCSSSPKPDTEGVEEHDTAITDTHSDSDLPTSPCANEDGLDTGIGTSTFGGMIEPLGETAQGTIGYTFYSLRLSDDGCLLEGEITSVHAVDPCPNCSWSFSMTPIESSVATGVCCELIAWHDGLIDGLWSYDWGFSEYYAYPYNGYYIPLTEVVWIGQDGSWSPLSFNWGDRGLYLTYQYGDAVSFQKLAPSWP